MELFYIVSLAEQSQFNCVVFSPKGVRAMGAPAVFMGTIDEASKMDEGTADAVCELMDKNNPEHQYVVQKWIPAEKRASF